MLYKYPLIMAKGMECTNYRCDITTKASVESIYRALTTEFDRWWTAPDMPIKRVGDVARFGFPPMESYWTFKAVELVPNKLVVLSCIDAYHLHEGMPDKSKTEWLDTQIVWSIESGEQLNSLHFEHRGLAPDLLCYEVCSAGWDFFYRQSLQEYLDTGVGRPHVG